MTDAMTHLPRYVPAQIDAARAAQERRARMSRVSDVSKSVNRQPAQLADQGGNTQQPRTSALAADPDRQGGTAREAPMRSSDKAGVREAPPVMLHLRPGERSGPPKVHEVQRAVCVYLGTRLEDMVGKSLHMRDVRPRQLAMYLAFELTGQTFVDIGRRFGGRDHTTAEHGWGRVRSAVENDPLYVRAVREIRETLR